MTSIIKVDTIQNSSGTSALSIGSGGEVTTQGAFLPGGLTAWPAFSASSATTDWYTVSGGSIIVFNRADSSADDYMGFNNGNHFSTSTYAFTCPIDGIYSFGFNIYTSNADPANGFSLAKNGSYLRTGSGTDINNIYVQGTDDINLAGSYTLTLSANDTIDVRANTGSDIYTGHSWFHGHLVAPL